MSDDEEKIAKERAALDAYKEMFPWQVPCGGASEDEIAMWEHQALEFMRSRGAFG